MLRIGSPFNSAGKWGTGENAVAGTEPIVVFDGEISSHLDYLSDREIEEILDDLGEYLAIKLDQERVEIVYRNHVWPLVLDPADAE